MDSKETLVNKHTYIGRIRSFSTFPVVGVIFVLIASTAFYVSRSHDEQVWLTLYELYSPYLLKKEKTLYLDFYNKRLSIEKQGSQAQSKRISDATQAKDNQQLTRFILSDRSFRAYLTQKAPIYFSPKDKDLWFSHNQELSSQLYRLTLYNFSIIPESFSSSPSITKLFTYIFVDDCLENLLFNIIILLILSSLMERLIKRKVFVTIVLGSSVTLSCLYIFVANSFSAPLQSLNALNYFLFAACFSTFIKAEFPSRFSNSWPFLVIGILILLVKIVFDFYLNIFSHEFLVCLIPMSILASAFGWFYQKRLFQTISVDNEVSASTIEDLDVLTKESRQNYAEALSGLSRFNFRYARQVLRPLRETCPKSLQILENSYHLEKLCPDEADFWLLAENRIEYCLVNQNYSEMLSVFQDIQKVAPSRELAGKNISPDHYLKMLVVFLNHNDIEKAEHAFMFLELAAKPVLVKEACKLLIDAFSKKQNSKKMAHYQALFESYFDAK